METSEQILIKIPGAALHLMEDGEITELARGVFLITRLTQRSLPLAILIKVGSDLQWPLTKDEPVVKLDEFHYLFSLPGGDGAFLNYGVSFSEPSSSLASLDSFLRENSCFSSARNSGKCSTLSAASARLQYSDAAGLYWKEYAPRIAGYNGVLAKAISDGTGQIIKGIFMCSDAYAKQVQNGGEMVRATTAENRSTLSTRESKGNKSFSGNQSGIQNSIKRVLKLSKTTEKLSRSLLNGVEFATGFAARPLIQSQAGKAFLKSAPGEVVLVSLDAVNKIMDAIELAERQALSATSTAVTGAVSQRYGENAGEVTEDLLAIAGHSVGTAWNILKLRKAVKPSSSLPSTAVKNAIKKR